MGNFQDERNIRLINNVIAHEVGHLIASLLLNEIQLEPKAEKIAIFWSEQFKKPGGKIEYSIKEGCKCWTFPKDLNLCYYSILSLYSGCIWEKFFNSIFHQKKIEIDEVELCFQSSGLIDAQEIGTINNLHLKLALNKESTREKIIIPYVELLNSIPSEKKTLLYNKLKSIATEVEAKIFESKNNLEAEIENFEELKNFINEEFIITYQNKILEIIENIKDLVKLEN